MSELTDFQLLRSLRRLRVEAPPELAGDVLAAVGLADSYASMPSAIGPMWVAWGTDGITAVVPADDEAAFVAAYGRPLQRVHELPAALLRRPAFDLRGLTDFERSVLDATRRIPAGEVRPYSWVAREIGRPGAVR